MLTLAQALKTGRLKEFAEQEERRGIGPVTNRKFDAALKDVATAPKPKQSADRTSRSPSRGGSRGK